MTPDRRTRATVDRPSVAHHALRPAGSHARGGFTLVELLVVIAIVILLLASLFVALRAARSGGARAAAAAALRQSAAGHSGYALDHDGRLVPGYLNPHIYVSYQFRTKAADGSAISPGAAGPYVWRLSPYVDNQWRTFHHGADESTLARLSSQVVAGQLTEVAFEPRIGLNTIFIGGDSDAGGDVSEYSPWNSSGNPSIAATRLTHLRTPASLVLFAPTFRAAAPGAPDGSRGWHELRAPFLQGQQWQLEAEGARASQGLAGFAGIPAIDEADESFPAAYCDGSVRVESALGISQDMTRWSPFADSPAWRVP